ncbi:beta-ketoacyl-ACP synthase I [Thioalkalivibrio sp. XN279]|uniref:beta-ketoacyl-ACP synthase I n=1 Tax=Thioalkalivibrio sp. XN279 TaxID=2714953 RepID=UPI0014084BE0|nr:beta-ketoacyl-ACP synthase I [Thioalkalivibrio sp. XN279]NHA13726.1 beta-ketoacyl-ACP synthase I [Thioalkalivibrio sp. XN279]
MRRVVVTGYGIVSSIGNTAAEVLSALREGRSGVRFSEEYRELGFRSHVFAPVDIDLAALIDRKLKRFMSDSSGYAWVAMAEALAHAGLGEDDIVDPRVGLVVGTGGASNEYVLMNADIVRSKGARKVGPYMVTRCMSSAVAANLATAFRIKGASYSISSACATSAHCIGHAAELIQWGKQDMVFAGGADEVHWGSSAMFDGMGALSSKYNDTPERASRTYDADRDGFVISGGGGILVLEALEHAQARGAPIIAELVGYGATSDGADMVQPSGEGAARCMRMALQDLDDPVDYLNSHGTSTPVGDVRELEAVREVFGAAAPPISSTKSLGGHALGAAGVNEAIHCLLMMEHGFISASANIENLDPAATGFDIVRERRDGAQLNTVMSNSFGFGGANATLVFRRF